MENISLHWRKKTEEHFPYLASRNDQATLKNKGIILKSQTTFYKISKTKG